MQEKIHIDVPSLNIGEIVETEAFIMKTIRMSGTSSASQGKSGLAAQNVIAAISFLTAPGQKDEYTISPSA